MTTLPATGIYLNAYPVTCSDPHTLYRNPYDGSREARRHLESEWGLPTWALGNDLFTLEPAPPPTSESATLSCSDNLALHGFLLRESLARQAASRGVRVWYAFGNTLVCAFPGRARSVGPVLVEPELHVQVSHEGRAEKQAAFVVRREYGWRLNEPLSADLSRALAAGNHAVRIGGLGVGDGLVVAVSGQAATLRRSGQELEVRAEDFALTANSTLIAQLERATNTSELFRQLRTASGSLTSSGRPNQYAIKDRQQEALALLSSLGPEIELIDGTRATVSPQPIEVRVQGPR